MTLEEVEIFDQEYPDIAELFSWRKKLTNPGDEAEEERVYKEWLGKR